MSRLTRRPLVQALLSRVLSGYLHWTLSTVRWRVIGEDIPEAVWAAGGGVVVCFWHSRLLLAPAIWPPERGQDARILVSLSPDGEFIAKAMERLMAGRTTVLIAHRLSTVRAADRIYVIEAGRVVEQGRHAELVAQGGLYSRLARAQNLDTVAATVASDAAS